MQYLAFGDVDTSLICDPVKERARQVLGLAITLLWSGHNSCQQLHGYETTTAGVEEEEAKHTESSHARFKSESAVVVPLWGENYRHTRENC